MRIVWHGQTPSGYMIKLKCACKPRLSWYHNVERELSFTCKCGKISSHIGLQLKKENR